MCSHSYLIWALCHQSHSKRALQTPHVLTAHWQYLEGAALAGVTVISKEEAKELYGVKEEGDASNPTNAATPPVDIPDQPRSIIIDILRRGLRSRRRKEIKKEIKQENKGSAGKKNKKNKKQKKGKSKGKYGD